VARDESGAEQTASCIAWGHATYDSSSDDEQKRTGVNVECELTVTRAGKHAVSGSIAWDRAIIPRSAALEVRRISPGR